MIESKIYINNKNICSKLIKTLNLFEKNLKYS